VPLTARLTIETICEVVGVMLAHIWLCVSWEWVRVRVRVRERGVM
jgi:hypothetical protein